MFQGADRDASAVGQRHAPGDGVAEPGAGEGVDERMEGEGPLPLCSSVLIMPSTPFDPAASREAGSTHDLSGHPPVDPATTLVPLRHNLASWADAAPLAAAAAGYGLLGSALGLQAWRGLKASHAWRAR